MVGRQFTILRQLCGWQSRRGRERIQMENNHKAIGCWTQRDGWRELLMQGPTSRRKFCGNSSPWAYGQTGRERRRTQLLIDNLTQALSTVPRGKRGASPYLYQQTGAAVIGKQGGRGPASSSRCSLGCCWFNKWCLVFDWFPFSEVTCFLSQLWPHPHITFCLLSLVLSPGKYIPGLPRWLIV